MATRMDFEEIITFEDMITEKDFAGLTDSEMEPIRPAGPQYVYFLVGGSCIICKHGK